MRRFTASERGAGMVEFAIVFPLFLLVVFGVIEVGRLLYLQTTLEHATRTAARAAIVRSERSGAPASTNDILAIIRKDSVVNTDLCTPDIRYSSGNLPGSILSIEVSCPFDFMFPLPGRPAFTIAAATEMVVVN
ncbi:Flp pilus assembly pilin Flp [Constrictibacter sp. MBR-5]|jgi:Flp pilus assembly pilin Flp|uniref:TadE/TadG family type IV pilus assembly protein n=1 Tax=Constrictibacter sp. MBR-5 TaxID=3156467 RepID=UPI003396CD74